MDPFSLGSGAVGIISLGFTVANGLFQVADGIGSAGQEVRTCAGEILSFAKLLQTVQTELEKPGGMSSDVRSSINDIFAICNRTFQPLSNMYETLHPLLIRFKDSVSATEQLSLRCQWYFKKKKKVLFYMETLQKEHRALDTLIATMNYQATKAVGQNTEALEQYVREKLAALELTYRQTRPVEFQIPFEESRCDSGPVQGERIIELLEDTAQVEQSREHTSHDNPVLAISPPTSNEVGPALSDRNLSIIEDKIDRDLNTESLQSAMEFMMDLDFLRRKVQRITAHALESDLDPQILLEINSKLAASMPATWYYTIGLICAGTLETTAMRAFLDEEHEMKLSIPPGHFDNYILGKIGSQDVFIASLTDAALMTTSAERVAPHWRRCFPKLEMCVLVETGSGVPTSDDIRLGDVAVSDPWYGSSAVWSCDFSRYTETKRLTRKVRQNVLPSALMLASLYLQSGLDDDETYVEMSVDEVLKEANMKPDERRLFLRPSPETDRLYVSSYSHVDESKTCKEVCDSSQLILRYDRKSKDGEVLKAHRGVITSTPVILRDATMRDLIADNDDMICFDTEAADIANQIPTFVACGIRDYADSHPCDEQWRGFAALAAAAYTKKLLLQLHLKEGKSRRNVGPPVES